MWSFIQREKAALFQAQLFPQTKIPWFNFQQKPFFKMEPIEADLSDSVWNQSDT